jgi:hypothetical protein
MANCIAMRQFFERIALSDETATTEIEKESVTYLDVLIEKKTELAGSRMILEKNDECRTCSKTKQDGPTVQ